MLPGQPDGHSVLGCPGKIAVLPGNLRRLRRGPRRRDCEGARLNFRRAISYFALSGAAMTVVPIVTATPVAASSAPEIVASGLDNPEKIAFGPDGPDGPQLYIAEAGTGGAPNADHSNCIPAGDEGQESCYGETGGVRVLELGDGDLINVMVNLPSLGTSEGASGPVDVAVADDGTIYTVISMGADPNQRDQAGAPFTNLGTIYKQGPNDTDATKFADVGAFERDNDPDKNEPRDPSDTEPTTDSNPYAMTMTGDGRLLVADAGGHDVVAVASNGAVSLVSALPFREVDAPPELGAPPGTKIPMQPVPTAVDVVPSQLPPPIGTDQIYIGQLTGFPFPVGAATVYTVNSNSDLHNNLDAALPGLTNVVDFTIAPDGTMYALEFASNGLLSDTPTPALIQIRTDGTRKTLLSGEDLQVPGGVAVGPDGMVYVSNCSLCGAGAGTIIKVDPTKARDTAIASACDPVSVPGSNFDDITQDHHREAIECLNWWGLVQGKTDTTFDPHAQVTRGQAASTVARLMEAAGYALPENPPNRFPDDDNSVHAHRIDQLAAVGVIGGFSDGTFRPDDPVNRGQIASLIVRAYNTVTSSSLAGAPDAFSDDTDSGHETDINAAAARHWVNGVGGGKYNPFGAATRDQVSSIIARVLSTLVDDGKATPPASG